MDSVSSLALIFAHASNRRFGQLLLIEITYTTNRNYL